MHQPGPAGYATSSWRLRLGHAARREAPIKAEGANRTVRTRPGGRATGVTVVAVAVDGAALGATAGGGGAKACWTRTRVAWSAGAQSP